MGNEATLQSELPKVRRTGEERFHGSGGSAFTVREFWSWAASDLMSNTLRGQLAEFLVARAVGAAGGIRREWEPWDVEAPDGTRIEVKSAAYVQTWAQRRSSAPSFSIAPAAAWSSAENRYVGERQRRADVYVFALLASEDRAKVDPLDLQQWRFFVVRTDELPHQGQIGLASVEGLATARTFDELGAVIAEIARRAETRAVR